MKTDCQVQVFEISHFLFSNIFEGGLRIMFQLLILSQAYPKV